MTVWRYVDMPTLRQKLSQPQPEEGTGAPFVLVDHHHVVVEDGVVHDERGTCKIA
jgi:hypothetical protein